MRVSMQTKFLRAEGAPISLPFAEPRIKPALLKPPRMRHVCRRFTKDRERTTWARLDGVHARGLFARSAAYAGYCRFES